MVNFKSKDAIKIAAADGRTLAARCCWPVEWPLADDCVDLIMMGHVGMMPVQRDDNGNRALATRAPMSVEPAA